MHSDEPMTDLPSMMSICESMLICDEGRPGERVNDDDNDDGDVTVRGLQGLFLVCVLGIFFFFLINTSVLCPLC